MTNKRVEFSDLIEIQNGAHVLYVYAQEKLYIENAASFIAKGLELGHAVVYIDRTERFASIVANLSQKGFTPSQLKQIAFYNSYVFYKNNDATNFDKVTKIYAELVHSHTSLHANIPLRTWASVEWEGDQEIVNKLSQHESESDKTIQDAKTFTVCAYNSDMITYPTQLQLMKSHQYLMTDTELFTSSLYDQSSTPAIHLKGDLETAIKQLRTYKEEVTRLDRLNLISQMASSISHEVRNPMTTVRGFLQLLCNKDSYAQDHEFFKIMIEELDRANKIISEFLSLGKNRPTIVKPQSLNKIIKGIVPLLQATAVEKGCKIVLQLERTPELALNNEEIRQVIINLVINGVEAMPQGGTVTIATYVDGQGVMLEIADNGNGIDPSIIHKLGTPFLTTKDTGTGLGLATSYRILDRHNATVEVNTSNTGTAFYIRFPLTADVPAELCNTQISHQSHYC